MRRLVPILAVLTGGCTFHINNPSLTANTAVGDGSTITPGKPAAVAPTAAPGGTPAPVGGAQPVGTTTPAPADGAPPDPEGVGAKDQEALKTSIALEASRDARVAQTFVAGKTGALGAVGVRLAYRGERAPDAVLRLYGAEGGGPKGEPLGEAALPAGEVTTNRDARWVAARFQPAVPVTAGMRYAWAIAVTGAYPLVVGAGDNRAYEAGEGWTSGGSGAVWNKSGMDLAFRTYLAP